MKKTIPLLALLLCLCLCASASAGADLSALSGNSFLKIASDPATGARFVTTTLKGKDLAFAHANESAGYYSAAQWDILVWPAADGEYPVLRLNLRYYTDPAHGFDEIDSVTFTVSGKQYTFTDLFDPDLLDAAEGGYRQMVIIQIGEKNIDFVNNLFALESLCLESKDQTGPAFSVPAVLHGIEDIPVTLGAGFLLDGMAVQNAFAAIGGMDTLEKVESAPMTVR